MAVTVWPRQYDEQPCLAGKDDHDPLTVGPAPLQAGTRRLHSIPVESLPGTGIIGVQMTGGVPLHGRTVGEDDTLRQRCLSAVHMG